MAKDKSATALRPGTPVTFLEPQDPPKGGVEKASEPQTVVERAGLIAAINDDGTFNVVYFGSEEGVSWALNAKDAEDFRTL